MRAARATRWFSAKTSSRAAKSPANRCAIRVRHSERCRSKAQPSGPRNSSHNLAFTRRPLMATHLDLEEQEQLDQLKAFWKQYGNLLTWALIAVLAAFAAWNAWNWWQRDQAVKAGAMFDELEAAAGAGDADRAAGIFADMKTRFPHTAFTQQGGLLAARTQFEKGKPDAALATLTWVSENAAEAEYQT